MRIVAERYVVLPDADRPGGQSTVVKAMDTKTGDAVALKLIPRHDADDTYRVFFRREVAALERLSHPNIVTLLDQGEDAGEDAFYLVFPWYEKNLLDVLSPDDFGWDDFADRWGMPLVDALAYAHERDVVHRDVKPTNILIGADSVPRLADFGISKIRSQIVPEATVVEHFSRPYAPPDLVGLNSASRDVWGFAATAVRCLTQGTLEDYPDLDAAFHDINVPPTILTLLRRCTSRDPEDRPRSAIELRSQLREIQTKRQRKWIQVRSAELAIREDAARRLVRPPFDRDAEAIERALEREFAHGSHLARVRDPNTGRMLTDTLDLAGSERRFRLAIAPDQAAFVVTKINNAGEPNLDWLRRSAWPVIDEVKWTSHRQPPTVARDSMNMILAALDEHYLRLDDEQQLRDENRMFDKWLDLLDAKEALERERATVLRYTSVHISGKRVRFQLTQSPDSDVIGQDRVCRTANGDTAGSSGVVVDQDNRTVTLTYSSRKAAASLPQAGELVLDLGASRASLRRQREAVINVRSGISVRPHLRRLLLDPTRIAPLTSSPGLTWFTDALDEDKKAAVAGALNGADFFVLQGPPGTGKTGFIAELVQQELKRNPTARILVVSQTHVAVDNALVRLADAGVTDLVRLGKPDDPRVAEEARRHLLEQQMQPWVEKIRQRAEAHLKEQARAASVDLTHVEGAAVILELIAALADQDIVRDRLTELTQPAAAATSRSPRDVDDDEVASELAGLNGRLQELGERVAQLRNRANSVLDGALDLPEDVTHALARDAFEAIVADDHELKKLIGILQLQAEWFQRIESSRDLEGVLLRRARVVAGTCIGFLSHRDVRDLEFDVCILDEASKATATETLVPLARSKRWVLVGDPHQLPPMQEEVLQHEELMTRFELDRADVEQSLFQWLLDHAPASAKHQLTHQYRMHPGIGDLVSACFYGGKLRSAGVRELPGWEGLYKPVAWLDTSHFNDRRENRIGTSTVNRCEVRAVQSALSSLRGALGKRIIRPHDGQVLRILVLTAYRKQMEELRRAVAGPASDLFEIEVNTVDAVQGRETDVTIFSVVRSNNNRDLGFLGEQHWRRINVALSRSRYGLVIIGDAPFCESNPGPLRSVLTYMRKNPKTCGIGAASHD